MSRRAKLIVLVAAALTAALLILRVRGVLTPFFLGGAVAYVSYPLVRLLESKQVPRGTAILLVYAMFAVFVILLVYAVLPSLTRELDQMIAILPEQTRRLEGLTDHALKDLQKLWMPEMLQEVVNLSLRRAEDLLGRFASRIAELLVGLVSHVFNLVLAPFLAYYLLRDLHSIQRAAIAWMPSGVRKDVLDLGRKVNHVVSGFLRGQLIVSCIVGILVASGLSLLGVKYAIIVGIFAGLADIIPYFGPLISAVPAVALALTVSPWTALWVVILLIAIQQFEGSVLSPKIVGDRVGLHPLTVIFAVLAGGELMGILGMLMAVPVAATVKVVAAHVGDRILERG